MPYCPRCGDPLADELAKCPRCIPRERRAAVKRKPLAGSAASSMYLVPLTNNHLMKGTAFANGQFFLIRRAVVDGLDREPGRYAVPQLDRRAVLGRGAEHRGTVRHRLRGGGGRCCGRGSARYPRRATGRSRGGERGTAWAGTIRRCEPFALPR